jgi:hypothetical protein
LSLQFLDEFFEIANSLFEVWPGGFLGEGRGGEEK